MIPAFLSNAALACADGLGLTGQHELVIGEIGQRQRHDEKDRVIELMAGLRGDRLRAVDLALALDTLGRKA